VLSFSVNAVRRLAQFDAQMFLSINALHRHFRLERVVRAVSFTGDGHFYVLLALILPLLYPVAGQHFLVTGLLCFALELPLYWVLKRSFKRRRPFKVVQALAPLLQPSDEFSFPSGHTTAAFMVACLISVFFPAASAVVYCWASLVGMSRVMLRVHFISDVMAGVLLGTSIALLALSIAGH